MIILGSKQLLYKRKYTNIKSQNDTPEMSVEHVGQILKETPKGIKCYRDYKINELSVNLRNIISNK